MNYIARLLNSTWEYAKYFTVQMRHSKRIDACHAILEINRRLGKSLPVSEVLPTIVDTLVQSLDLGYAGIYLWQEDNPRSLVFAGQPSSKMLTFPLQHENKSFGELQVAPRVPYRIFSSTELILLGTLTQHIAVITRTVLMIISTERCRQVIVSERELIQCQMATELYDGIGHQLAGILRYTEQAAHALDTEPADTRAKMNEIKHQLQSAITQVRTLAGNLYPPELELLGLEAALQEFIGQYQSNHSLEVNINIAPNLPPLSIAFEAAIYYTAREVLANTLHHPSTTRCSFTLGIAEAYQGKAFNTLNWSQIQLEISNNGIFYNNSLQWTAIKHRIMELGGTLTVECPSGGGTRLLVLLPLYERRQ